MFAVQRLAGQPLGERRRPCVKRRVARAHPLEREHQRRRACEAAQCVANVAGGGGRRRGEHALGEQQEAQTLTRPTDARSDHPGCEPRRIDWRRSRDVGTAAPIPAARRASTREDVLPQLRPERADETAAIVHVKRRKQQRPVDGGPIEGPAARSPFLLRPRERFVQILGIAGERVPQARLVEVGHGVVEERQASAAAGAGAAAETLRAGRAARQPAAPRLRRTRPRPAGAHGRCRSGWTCRTPRRRPRAPGGSTRASAGGPPAIRACRRRALYRPLYSSALDAIREDLEGEPRLRDRPAENGAPESPGSAEGEYRPPGRAPARGGRRALSHAARRRPARLRGAHRR